MSFNLRQFIGSVAPTLAAALGGPFAGMAVKAIGAAVGIEEPTQAKIEQTLATANPDVLLKLREADYKFAETMKQLDVDVFKLEVADRDSARQREIALKDQTPAHLAYMIIGGFFMLSVAQIITIMGWPELVAKVPGQGWLVIGNVSGYLAAEAKAAAAYYFGTTAGSKDKDTTIADIAKQP